MSQLSKSVQYAYRYENFFRLNMHQRRSILKEDTKISHCGSRSPKYVELGHFTLIVVLQRTANKCTKIQNARAEPWFCSLNLLFADALVVIVVC